MSAVRERRSAFPAAGPSVESAQEALQAGNGFWHTHAALLTITITSVLIGLDSMMVNLALPHVKEDFNAGAEVSLVVTAYLLGSVAILPSMAWMSGRWGTRKPYLVSLLAMGAASLFAAVAPNLPALIVARLLVGLVGSPAIPMTMMIVTTIYPIERRGRAMAMWGSSGIIGPALGPTVGGRLADAISWRWLFLITAPLMLIAYAINRRFVPDVHNTVAKRLDPVGMLLGPFGLLGVLLGLSQGRQWGWTSAPTLVLLVGGAVLLVSFVRHDLRAPRPLLDLRLVRLPGFTRGSFLAAVMISMMTARLLFVPLLLHDVRDYGTTRIGLLLAPQAITSGLALFIGGRSADRAGPRRALMAGSLLSVGTNLLITRWTPGTPDALLLATLMLHAFGVSLFQTNAMVVTLWQVPPERMASAATLRQMLLQVGNAFSAAVLAAVLGAQLADAKTPVQIEHAYSAPFYILSGLAFVGFLATLGIPKGALRRDASAGDPPAGARR